MSDPEALIDPFVRGIAVGALLVMMLSVWRSAVSRHTRVAAVLLAAGLIGWVVCESRLLWGAFGDAYPFAVAAWPTAGLFWLFVAAVFEDRRVTAATLAPAALLLVSGAAMGASAPPVFDVIWSARNIFGGLLALHAGAIIVRGWRDDLVEGRRRLRVVVLGLSAIYALVEVVVSFAYRLDPQGPWLRLTVGEFWGGCCCPPSRWPGRRYFSRRVCRCSARRVRPRLEPTSGPKRPTGSCCRNWTPPWARRCGGGKG